MSILTDLQAAAAVDPAFIAYRLVRNRKFGEAVKAYDRILEDAPDKSPLWVNRGVALQAENRLEEAIASFNTALACDDEDYGAYVNRGIVYGWLGKYHKAIADYARAIELEPDSEPAHLGRAVILAALGNFEDAVKDADYVLAMNPGSGDAHYNKALSLLSMGQYAEGFREHEWRFGTKSVLGQHRFKKPMWQGEKTSKRILVHCEQGLGDNLQLCRYLDNMKHLNVTIEAPKQLSRLFEVFGFPVVERGLPLEFDLHCPMMSLAAIFGTTLETVPKQFPYLRAEKDDIAHWKRALSGLTGKKVGVSWSSGVRLEQVIAVTMQRRKSIPTKDFAGLLDVPGISFVSLQKEEPHDGVIPSLYDPMPQVRDLADTAAIIANLDLVVTVDSAVAHLAGAMGKPVWVLNRYDICWRWLSGETESPWYDNVKIYRQHAPMKWDGVLSELKEDLEKYATGTPQV